MIKRPVNFKVSYLFFAINTAVSDGWSMEKSSSSRIDSPEGISTTTLQVANALTTREADTLPVVRAYPIESSSSVDQNQVPCSHTSEASGSMSLAADLFDIPEIRVHIKRLSLEITPDNYELLNNQTDRFRALFNNFNKGVFIKWSITHGFDQNVFLSLLSSLKSVTKFKVSVEGAPAQGQSLEFIWDSLQGLSNLHTIDLLGCGIDDEAMEYIMDSMASPFLTKLDLRRNQVTAAMVSSIKKRFESLLDLQWDEVKEAKHDAQEKDMVIGYAHASAVVSNTTKSHVEPSLPPPPKKSENVVNIKTAKPTLTGNGNDFILEEALRNVVKKSSKILSFKAKRIGDSGVVTLLKIIKETNVIQEINLSGNMITNLGLIALSEMLKVNNFIISLDLSYNHVRDEGVCFLSEALMINRSIRKLSLGGNSIADGGVRALSETLKVNSSIHELILCSNRFGEGGVIALSEMLVINRVLNKLTISNNRIGNKGCIVLMEALKINRGIQNLDIASNLIGEEAGKIIWEMIKINQFIHTISIHNNQIGLLGMAIEQLLSGRKKS